MSVTNTYGIACPKCKESQEVDLYDSVNVSEHPELKERLLLNQLNRVVCGQCGLDFRVDKHLLYSDPDRRILIQLLPCSLAELEVAIERFEESSTLMSNLMPGDIEAPELLLVIDRSELVERIYLAEAGLNPRLVEYIKYMIHVRNHEQANPRTRRLLFNAEDSTDDILLFVVQDLGSHQFSGALQYDRRLYEALGEALDHQDDQAAMIMELFPGPYISARANILREEDVEDLV